MARRLLNYYPNYSTHRLYFGEVETPYLQGALTEINNDEDVLLEMGDETRLADLAARLVVGSNALGSSGAQILEK